MPSHTARRLAALAAVMAAALTAAGCAQSDLRLGPDYGVAIRQDMAAQIADPDAQYAGVPAPASNGQLSSAAVTRYNTGKTTRPIPATTSNDVGQSGSGVSQPTATSSPGPS
jgi:hypothetical protein